VLLMRLLVKMLAIVGICLVLQIVPASADTVTLQVDASLTTGIDPSNPTTDRFVEPLLYVTGQFFLDTTTLFWSDLSQPPPNGVLGVDLTFTGPNGSLHEVTNGNGVCWQFFGTDVPAFTCSLSAPGFLAQSYLFFPPLFTVGQTAQICGVRDTIYPDGAQIFGSSGVCGGTSSVTFLGNHGEVYSLRDGPVEFGEGSGSSSGRFTVTAISTTEPGILPLLATGLVSLVGLKLRRRTASRCVIN